MNGLFVHDSFDTTICCQNYKLSLEKVKHYKTLNTGSNNEISKNIIWKRKKNVSNKNLKCKNSKHI